LKLQYDETLSDFAFKFNLRRSTEVQVIGESRVVLQDIKSSDPYITGAFTAGAYTRPLLSST
jgi:hypothetical protein